MPRFDQTGPRGMGRRTGRGLGKCDFPSVTEITNMMDSNDVVYGRGRGGIPCGWRKFRNI